MEELIKDFSLKKDDALGIPALIDEAGEKATESSQWSPDWSELVFAYVPE
ncbi:MAG: hypothetical protein HRT90_02125 [Candidatus Margulisbacteria bacterium]|nr:hypothetical protein [Candidatus Margulisiibacteriota bacterium]